MKHLFSLILPFLAAAVVFNSCNNNKSESPFAEILNNPPFAAITDSIQKDPKNDELYFRRAVMLNKNDLPEPSLVDFRKAWSLKKDERYAFGLGNLMLDKKPDSAVLFLENALKELPNSFLLQLTLARALNTLEKSDEALAIISEMLKKNPNQVDILKMKADILRKKDNKSEMIATLEKAYSLTPADVELNNMLAFGLAESKNPRVLPLCDSLIKADSLSVHAEPYYYKGLYYSNINDKMQALAWFNNAIKVDYQFLDGYIEKGRMLYELKKYKEALEVFKLCLNVSPKFPDAHYWIAKTQEAMGEKEEALLNYRRAYGLDQDFKEAKEGIDRLSK